MADTEISALPAATTLAGTEVVPVVQSGATKKATVTQVLAAEAAARAAADALLQPLDSDLTAIAALSTTSFGRSLLALADAAAGRTALALGTAATSASTAFDAAGSAAAAQAASQPLDSDLTAIAALTTTAYGRAFLSLADGPALRAVLGTGIADATTFLRGDGTWAAAGGGDTTAHLDDEHLRIRDEFDRANSVGSLGVTTTHERTWSGEAAWSITSQRLHKTGGGYALLTLDPHHAFGHWSVTLGPGCDSAEWWLVFRVVDANNYFRIGRGATNVYDVQRIVAGSLGAADAMLARNTPHAAPTAGDVITVVNLPDDGIDVYRNGVLYWTGAELDDHTERTVGLASASATPTFERVEFLPIAGGDATMLALDAAVATKASLAGATFTGAVAVPDAAYGVGWNASAEVPTKNAVYDKIETLVLGGGAPTDATYVTLSANGTLSAESVLGSAVNMRGTLAARPAAGTAGREYTTTDDIQARYRDNGASWDQVAPGLNEPTLQRVAKAGTLIGTRHRLNLIEGSNVTLTVADDGANDEVDITIAAAGGSGTGMELLGSATLGTQANTMTAITIAARDHLQIVVLLAGYDSADAPVLRFNADAGTNYSDRHVTVATGGTTLANSENLSATAIRIGNTNSTQARMVVVNVGNLAAAKKVATIVPAVGSSGAATASLATLVGTGVWHNAVDQITSVQLRSLGANNILAGTKILIYGKNV